MEPLTPNEIVGQNVRARRQELKWSQDDLRERLERYMTVSRPVIAQLENAKRRIDVNELVWLALVLGVAPHHLLYPPRDTDVRVGEEGQAVIAGAELAEWLWAPDESPFQTYKGYERRRWVEAVEETDQL